MILVFNNVAMTTQGHLNQDGLPTVSVKATGLMPRRSVVLTSVGTLVVGVMLSATALPALAGSIASTTTTSAPAGAVTTTTAPPATTTTMAPTPSTTVVVPPTTVPRPVIRQRAVVRHAVTTTTPTTVPVTRPVTTTTVAAKPATVKPSVALKLSSNIAPSPNFLVSGTGSIVNGVVTYQNPCITPQSKWPVFTNDVSCTDYLLSAINNARAIEGVRSMALPTNWFSLTVPQQLFVVANLERVDRGLPPYLGLNSALNAEAQHAAQANQDPGIAAGFPIGNDAQGVPGMGGAWSGGFNVLAADYIWMYDDGWSGAKATTSNIACTSAGDSGCWAHRAELLGSDPGFNPGVGLQCANCEMGTGYAVVNGQSSFVDLIELPKGAQPPMTFTWARDVLPFLS
jgi:hypothetical protein